MSSNCPPQLQLSIQPSTTTFKRSFEQFGFDFDSPVGATDAGGSGTDNGNERNKRARSSSSFSQSSDSTDASRNTASTLASGSDSSSSILRDEPDSAITNELQVVVPTARPSTDPPPRLPTPIIQDIDMAEVLPENDTEVTGAPQQTPQQTEDRYRLSLQRFNAFESEIALLRRSQPLSPAITRSPTPPPMLPPLSIGSSSDQHLHQHQNTHHRLRASRLSPTDLAFFRHSSPRSTSPFLDHFLNASDSSTSTLSDSATGGEDISVHEDQDHQEDSSFQNALYRFRNSLPSSVSRHDQHQQRSTDANESADDEIEMVNGFRDRLNTALERLRPASPLVPGLEGSGDDVGDEPSGQDQDVHDLEDEDIDEAEGPGEENDEQRVAPTSIRLTSQSLPPNPPTLPPIPPITADTDTDDWTSRPLIDRDFIQADIRPPAASQNELEAQVIREIREQHIEMRQHLQNLRSLSSSSTSGWPPASNSGNPSLRDLPLPSPILRDLRSWMQERAPFGATSAGDTTDTSTTAHLDSSTTTSNSSTNSHAGQSQRSEVLNTQSVSTSPQQSQSNINSGGVSRVNEWDFGRFPPQSSSASGSSGLASAGGSSSSASTSGTAQEPSRSNSFASASSSTSNSDMFSNTTSVSYSRNLADEAAVRSLDHGIGMGLGFGPGAARPMPPLVSSGRNQTPRRNDATDSEQPQHTSSPTLTSTANGLGQAQAHRPITRFPSGSWPSWARESGMGPLPDLDLDFSNMGTTAGSAMSSPSTSDDWRVEGFPAAPPGDRSPIVRDSSPTTATATTISLHDSFLNPTMTSLDFFSTTAAGPGPANLPPNANHRHIWTELPSSSSSHEGQQTSLRSVLRCPHNPQCAYGPPSQPSHAGAGPSTGTNTTQASAERSQPETRRTFGMGSADRNPDIQYRRWLMDGEFGAESDSLPLPNRISSTSTPLLSRLNASRAVDGGHVNPFSYRLPPAADTQQTFPHSRLRTSHSHARLGSSTSLVSETASEMRRLEDYAEVARARTMHTLSTGSRVPGGGEDRSNADNMSTEESSIDESNRDVRRALAWDEIRARHRHLYRHVGGGQASNSETPTDTRSSIDRMMQNAWQTIDSPDNSLSSPENVVPSWRARNLSTPTSATPAATSEDVDMSMADRIEAQDMYWTTLFRELGFERPLDAGNAHPSAASQNRRESWESDYNPYSLSWSDTILNLNTENRPSGIASASTSPTGDSPTFNTSRFPSFSSLVERSAPVNPTRNPMDISVERPLRRIPLTYSRVPSLPSPDLGGTFSAERPAQPTSPIGTLQSEEPSRHFSGLSNRNPRYSTLGNHSANASHYQNSSTTTSANPSINPARFNARLRQRRSLTPEYLPRPVNSVPSWDVLMDTSEDSAVESNLFASLLESQERLVQLTAINQARFASLRRASNLAEFAPGPFRNTLQHNLERHHAQHNAHRLRAGLPPSNPPTIPPLSFGDNLTSLSNSVPGSHPRSPEEADANQTNAPFHTSRDMPPRRDPARPARPGAPGGLDSFSHPIMSRSFASARAEANRARAQGDLLFHRQMRMEASRSSETASQRSGAATNGSHSLDEIETMVRNRQLLENSLRNRNRSRYGISPDGPAPPTRPVYPGSMDDDDALRESFSTFSARGRRNRLHSHEMMFFARGGRRGRPLGDFMRDEDFDESYESLLSLAQTLGDVKPRSTPVEVIEKMEKAQYKDWATAESDQRCPICLDDYGPTDPVLKLTNCSHWLHQDCLHQWLQTANTCPVCRKSVSTNTGFRRGHHHRNNPFGGPGSFRRDPPGPGPSQGRPGSDTGNNPPSSNQGHHHHHHHHHGFPPAPWRRGPPPV